MKVLKMIKVLLYKNASFEFLMKMMLTPFTDRWYLRKKDSLTMMNI